MTSSIWLCVKVAQPLTGLSFHKKQKSKREKKEVGLPETLTNIVFFLAWNRLFLIRWKSLWWFRKCLQNLVKWNDSAGLEWSATLSFTGWQKIISVTWVYVMHESHKLGLVKQVVSAQGPELIVNYRNCVPKQRCGRGQSRSQELGFRWDSTWIWKGVGFSWPYIIFLTCF